MVGEDPSIGRSPISRCPPENRNVTETTQADMVDSTPLKLEAVQIILKYSKQDN